MEPIELLQRLGVALAIGLLIGLERGWQAREDAEGERAAGLRTNALASLLGGIWGAIAFMFAEGGPIVLGLAFVVFSSAVILFRYRETADEGTYGATTVVAVMLAFALGALAVVGDQRIAAASAVAASCLLAMKALLHNWIKHISWVELRSGLVLAAMTIILLPILPNRTIDPWSAINPYEIWLMTVMITAISFAGYVAVKLTGERQGIVLSGIGGGLASSTATTVLLSRLARDHPQHIRLLVGGVAFSQATMFARVLVLLIILNLKIFLNLLLPLASAGILFAIVGLLLVLRQGRGSNNESHLELKNPFELSTVLQFGALLTFVVFLVKIIPNYLGSTGIYILSAISGLADVDAITLSMARLGGDQLRPIRSNFYF